MVNYSKFQKFSIFNFGMEFISLFFFLLWCVNIEAAGTDIGDMFTINKITYTITSNNEVEVGDVPQSQTVTIPENVNYNNASYTVTSITAYCFTDNVVLQSVSLPNTIKGMGESCFAGCSKLSSIKLPSQLAELKANTFQNCSALEEISFGKQISSLGDNCFQNCSKLSHISLPSSLTMIGNSCFAGSAIENISLPQDITTIGTNCFSECKQLKSATINASIRILPERAFKNCKSLKTVLLPESLVKISNEAFDNCKNLEELEIPETVTDLGNYTFVDCTKLKAINIPPHIIKIGIQCFGNCFSLASIELPNGIKTLDTYAFSGCESLVNINLPNSLKTIGTACFRQCSSLKSITIPNSVEKMEGGCFADCISLCAVQLPKSIQILKTSYYSGGKGFFENCQSLQLLSLPSSITEISESAFKGCTNLKSFICYAPIPPKIYYDNSCFNGTSIDVSGKLYVPSSSIALYKESKWNQWAQILAIGSEEIPDVKKCEEPKLYYKNGKIQFTCETPNAKFHYRLVNNDVTDSYEMVSGSEINLDAKYELSIYATADGFLNSNTVTATLYWLNANLETDNINQAQTRGIVVSSDNGIISISGLDNNEKVSFYSIDGITLGSQKAIDGCVNYAVGTAEKFIIVRIGNNRFKVTNQ